MKKQNTYFYGILFLLLTIGLIVPESALAQVAFESKVRNLTNQLITVVLPLLSVLGLVYAVFMAVTGDGAAKGRIIFVISCSILGFLAPQIISWIQSVAG